MLFLFYSFFFPIKFIINICGSRLKYTFFVHLLAQNITVTARIDSTSMWIGEQTKLSFEISQQPNQKVVTPLFSDTIIGGLEIVEPMKADTVSSPDGHLLVTQHYVVTAFEDSLLYIPPYPFVSKFGSAPLS